LYASREPNDPTELDVDHVRNGIDQCLLDLEEARLEEGIDYYAGALIEAESIGDRSEAVRLLEIQRELTQAKGRIQRRRDEVTNLASAGGHR
jgi:hypothetical protein